MSNISPELIAQFDEARAAGKALAQMEPRAVNYKLVLAWCWILLRATQPIGIGIS